MVALHHDIRSRRPRVVPRCERHRRIPGEVASLLLLRPGAEVNGAIKVHRAISLPLDVRPAVLTNRRDPQELGLVEQGLDLHPKSSPLRPGSLNRLSKCGIDPPRPFDTHRDRTAGATHRRPLSTAALGACGVDAMPHVERREDEDHRREDPPRPWKEQARANQDHEHRDDLADPPEQLAPREMLCGAARNSSPRRR